MRLSEELAEAVAKGATSFNVPSPKQLYRKQNPRKRHEIDDQWIAGIRKWWKGVVAKAKTYDGRPKEKYSKVGTWEELAKAADASMAFLNSVKGDIERLKIDLLMVKGFWDQHAFRDYKKMTPAYKRKLKKEDPEHLEFMLSLEKEDAAKWKPIKKVVGELDAAVAALTDAVYSIQAYKEGSHPEGIYSPSGRPTWKIFDDPEEYDRMMRSIRVRVDEAVEKADKAISGRLLRSLSSLVKKKGDIGGRYTHSPQGTVPEDVVHVGRATLVFKDLPQDKDPKKERVVADMPYKSGGRVHSRLFDVEAIGMAPRDRKKLISSMKRAEALLRRKGVGQVWYGDFVKLPQGSYRKVFGSKTKTGGSAAASFSRDMDMVHIYSNHVDSDTLIHELGHRYYYKFLSAAERRQFKKWFGKVKAPSTYGGTDEVEEFAELFLGHVAGRRGSSRKKIVLDRDQRNRFAQFLGRKKRLESLADRLRDALCN